MHEHIQDGDDDDDDDDDDSDGKVRDYRKRIRRQRDKDRAATPSAGAAKDRAGEAGGQTEKGQEEAVAEEFASDGTYRNKQRVLLFSSRGITSRFRHLLADLRKLVPHHKKVRCRVFLRGVLLLLLGHRFACCVCFAYFALLCKAL